MLCCDGLLKALETINTEDDKFQLNDINEPSFDEVMRFFASTQDKNKKNIVRLEDCTIMELKL